MSSLPTGLVKRWVANQEQKVYLNKPRIDNPSEITPVGAHVLLGPTVNTQRSPLGGRGFESFAEDPYLNGTIAAAYIRGLQSKGVSATIKHFVANDQESQK